MNSAPKIAQDLTQARVKTYTQPDWAKTRLGTNILCTSSYQRGQSGIEQNASSKAQPEERPILFIGGVHGDEPEGVEIAKQTLNWLKTTPVPHKWLLIQCINPDGFKSNERTNSAGVDLNRNFPSDCWTSEHENPRYNPGLEAASEPEVAALIQLIQLERPKLIVHCHSWNPCIVYTGATGQTIAEELAQRIGYAAQPTIGYDCPGSLGEFGWEAHQIPVICLEAQEGDPLETIWPRFADGIRWLFQECPI